MTPLDARRVTLYGKPYVWSRIDGRWSLHPATPWYFLGISADGTRLYTAPAGTDPRL